MRKFDNLFKKKETPNKSQSTSRRTYNIFNKKNQKRRREEEIKAQLSAR